MGEATSHPLVGTPYRWYIVFATVGRTYFTSLIALGRLKHVRAFGFVPQLSAWVFYDVSLGGTEIVVAKGMAAEFLMTMWAKDACIIEMPPMRAYRAVFRVGFWCVPAVKHLIGLKSRAFRPDRLWLDCLQAGGKVVGDGCGVRSLWRWQRSPAAADQARPDDVAAQPASPSTKLAEPARPG